jgi:hypothetical protein
MAWRDSARCCGAALAVLSISVLGLARPASAQEIERMLAGVRLGTRSTSVLAKYGNPNDVVIGDIGIRQAPPSAAGAATAAGGPGSGSLPGLPGSGYPGSPPGGGFPGSGSSGYPGSQVSAAASPIAPNFPGGGSAYPGAQGGFPGGGSPMSEVGGGFPGSGSPSGYPGAGGPGGAGGFGQTVSPLAHEQEVTWVYNRKVGNNVVSYEFLIGPSGDVSQIRVSGYGGGNTKTRRGIMLGSTYKDVVRTYGYPEDHQQVGSVLVASYKQRAHVSFQFLNQSGNTNAFSSGNKIIAITIATTD